MKLTAVSSQHMKPLLTPGFEAKKGGKALDRLGSTRSIILAVEILPNSPTYRARVSKALAGYSPWKLPAEMTLSGRCCPVNGQIFSAKIRGLSVELFISTSNWDFKNGRISITGP
jgi:hypothetical protein